ncbi:MAG: DNA adenine methylase, partial [Planctomycetaceae bacterium]
MNITAKNTITRPALRYFGGKFRLSTRWIIPQFPPHTCYVEPFGGAMGVLLNKVPAMFEVYNDLDGEVVNFFRMLRERPNELIRAIELTPYSRMEQVLSFNPTEGVDDLERARRLYVRCWQSHGGGRTQWRTGWRYQVNNHRGKRTIDDWNQT